MEQKNIHFPVLAVTSVKQLLSYEKEIVERINCLPNGGRLLLTDPQRLMKDIQIELSSDVLAEWRSRYPEFFAPTNREHVYDAVTISRPGNEIIVNIKGLFRRKKS
jgi:hypothetical protein